MVYKVLFFSKLLPLLLTKLLKMFYFHFTQLFSLAHIHTDWKFSPWLFWKLMVGGCPWCLIFRKISKGGHLFFAFLLKLIKFYQVGPVLYGPPFPGVDLAKLKIENRSFINGQSWMLSNVFAFFSSTFAKLVQLFL